MHFEMCQRLKGIRVEIVLTVTKKLQENGDFILFLLKNKVLGLCIALFKVHGICVKESDKNVLLKIKTWSFPPP